MPLTLTRSLLVVLVPGIVAVSPWLIWVVKEWGNAANVYQAFPNLITAFLFAIVVVLGSIFEGLGTLLEVRWDKERETAYDVTKNWYVYLSRTYTTEPVGYSYISRAVTTLYFELSMVWATSLFFLGCTVLVLSAEGVNRFVWFGLFGCAIVSPIYFWWQARCSHQLLCETRQRLNELYSSVPGK